MHYPRIFNQICYMSIIVVFLFGCATTYKDGPSKFLALDPDYKYKIIEVNIDESKEYEIDVNEMMRTALEKNLRQKELLWDESSNQNFYQLCIKIIDYDMGSAFKRWLLPGYGSTVLNIHTEIIDKETGKIVNEIDHRQTVTAGGLLSVGAWEHIFNTVAAEVTEDLSRGYQKGGGFTVKLDPWLKNETEGPNIKQSGELRISKLIDMREDKSRIGEREVLGLSMGNVYMVREVSAYMTEALQNDLLAAGISLTDNSKVVAISGAVNKFWVYTDSTPLYWDVKCEIEITVTATSPETNKSIDKTYAGNSSIRTWVWPSEKIIDKAVNESIKSFMYDFRKDCIWSNLNVINLSHPFVG